MASLTPAKYIVKVRNAALQIVGEVQPYQMTMKSRFNIPGSWMMVLGSDDPMATTLATPGAGIYVTRSSNGGPYTYYYSGPVRYIKRNGIRDKTLTVAGYDDLAWVADRQAYPGGYDPYSAWITFNTVLRAYTFGEPSGTVATDFSPFAQNGTYTGTFTLNQTGYVDDPALATLFGSNGYVSVPTFGLVAANQPFGDMVWFYYPGAPASTAVLSFRGTPSTASCVYMGILNTGRPTMQLKGTNYSGTSALTVGWHSMWMNYDSTTARLYVDGVQVATGVPGVCTVAYGSAAFGCIGAGASNFAATTLQYGCFFQGNLGNASLPGSQMNGLPWPTVYYDLGVSLYNINQYDSESGPAETVIKTYVNNNLGPLAASTRVNANVAIDTDAAQGAAVAYNGRFERLLDQQGQGLLQVLALAGGVGMQMVQTATPSLLFKVYVPAVNPAAKFSVGLGNLVDYDYEIDAQTIVNADVMGGGGTGLARVYVNQTNATSIGRWGRIEGFDNGGSATDKNQLKTQAAAVLDAAAEKTSFTCLIIETVGSQYIRDYNLGDIATVEAEGQVITANICEVDVTLDAAQGETLTIAIGTPYYAQVWGALTNYIGRVNALGSRLALLERV